MAKPLKEAAGTKMETNNDYLQRQIISDLAINARFTKGQDNEVHNCWHFSTDGNSIDEMFYDDEDFRNGMNRIYVVSRRFRVVILAFCLMDTHIHFVLYGQFYECNIFVHEYVRLTSMYMTKRHQDRNKLSGISISHQTIDTDYYLKTVICYTIKNPVAAGLAYPILRYPWSSGPLYFNVEGDGYWMSPVTGISTATVHTKGQLNSLLKTHTDIKKDVLIIDGTVHPSEYVAYKVVEQLFRSVKGFNYFLCRTKEDEVDARGGVISNLSIPIQEMRNNRNCICQEMFGTANIRTLDTQHRLKLARALKSRYNSSLKQIARLCCLSYEEIKGLF